MRTKLGLPPPPTGTCNIIDDIGLKCLFADCACRGRYFAKCDIGDAYTKATRARPAGYMYMPDTIKQFDDDGCEMVACLTTPLWGEVEAGFEWDVELHETLLAEGWRQCSGVPAMYYFNGPDGDCRLVKIVDDIGFSESSPEQTITKATIARLRARYNNQVTSDLNPTSFAGYKLAITRDAQGTRVALSQELKVTEAVRKYMPELLEGHVPTVATGTRLDAELDALTLPKERTSKLDGDQKLTQRIIGDLKYFERGTCPRLTRRVHRLSCIMGFPPPEALHAAKGVLADAYHHRHEKIVFAANSTTPETPVDGCVGAVLTRGAPATLEVCCDAALVPVPVYSVLMTYGGASILHCTKKIGPAVASTHDAENVATVKASELAVYARIVLGALGVPIDGATTLLTDNLSNQRVAQNAQSSSRSRYYLIRSACLHQRVADGEITVAHVRDEENPADFLTKTIPSAKTEDSICYALGTSLKP